MKAIILAAGRGSRMKHLTDERPKCLVELHGVPLLDYQIKALSAAGVSEIAIVTGYKRELLQNKSSVEFYNPKWSTTNMVSSLACAAEWLTKENCIISYSDIFYSASAITSLIEAEANLAITYDKNWLRLWKKRFGDPLLDAETFKISEDNSLIEIGKKPNMIDEVQGQYMGLLRLTPKAWNEIIRIRNIMAPKLREQMHMTATLQKVIDSGNINILAVPYEGTWGEIDSEQDLRCYG